MQLKTTTDYAIRTLIYLAEKGGISSSTEVADRMRIPHKYLINTAKYMKNAGLICTHNGSNGGYSLAKNPEDITLLDIVNVMEGTMKISRCIEADMHCSRFAAATCPLRTFYLELQSEMEDHLRSTSIGSLLEQSNSKGKIIEM